MSVNFATDGITLENIDKNLMSEKGWRPNYGDTPHNRAIIKYVSTLSAEDQLKLANRDDLKPLFNYENTWAIKYMAELAVIEVDNERAFENLRVKPLEGKLPSGPEQTLRWPSDAIDESTDYVFFQFGKYVPPFSSEAQDLRKQEGVLNDKKKVNKKKLLKNSSTSATYEMYNSSAIELKTEGRMDIMLPIPQDLSNEIQQVWSGKQFTATGRAATAALAAGNFSFASEVAQNISGNMKALQTAFNTSVLNSIPGVGGNIDFNDVSGSTRGIVINPNAELLYDSPEMREIGMIFKMVAQNEEESQTIHRICNAFRRYSMPRWGTDDPDEARKMMEGVNKAQVQDKNDRRFDVGGEDNWIQVPDLCKFTFMSGSNPHPYLIQFKPCAISGVEVNYTPDGTYNTYRGTSAPVAVELRLNFMETKLIFSEEVELGY